MNRYVTLALIAALFTGSAAVADDTVTRATPTDSQRLKDCIEKQKMTDVTMSKAQMTRMCKDQLKQQKSTGAPIDPPPTDTPKT